MLNSHQPFLSLIVGVDAHELCTAELLFKQAGMNTKRLDEGDMVSYHPSLTDQIVPLLNDVSLD